jgi:hypothetical protein
MFFVQTIEISSHAPLLPALIPPIGDGGAGGYCRRLKIEVFVPRVSGSLGCREGRGQSMTATLH